MRMNRKNLAHLYNISERTLGNYLKPHQARLKKMATKINLSNGKLITLQRYNKAQLTFIIKKIMQDPPEGYNFIEGLLVKIPE
jgi:hypothetical protein